MKYFICKHGETKKGTNRGEDYVDEHVAHEILAIAERMAKSGAPADVRRFVPGSAMPC